MLRPAVGLVSLAAFVAAAMLLLHWRRIARVPVDSLLKASVVCLPFLALLGPSFAPPSVPQLFLYRIGLLFVGVVGLSYLIVKARPLRFAAADVSMPLVLWFAWLAVGLLWAGDKSDGFGYLAVVATMMAATAAAAVCGVSRRALVALSITLAVGYGFIVGFALLEAGLGVRLPMSRYASSLASGTYAVTSVFHNQNDLATYLALCWPFLLCALFFARRRRWIVLSLLLIVLGSAVFVRTGSRSSLVAIAVSSLGAVALFANVGSRLSSRAGKILGTVIVVGLAAGAGLLLFNNSDNAMLRQFRLEALLSQAQSGTGSGAIRTDLTSRGLEIAGTTFLLGAGPGQAERIVSSGVEALGISNLHNWWLETYVNGGLVGFGLHFALFLALLIELWPIARHDPDLLLRYLASGTLLALLGFTIGALGPSSSAGFAPLWILYGLGLAVISRSRLAEREITARTPGPALRPLLRTDVEAHTGTTSR